VIRLIVKRIDYGGAAHGADMPAITSWHTVEINSTELERLVIDDNVYVHHEITGHEVVPKGEKEANDGNV
jgi:hypothetical protein